MITEAERQIIVDQARQGWQIVMRHEAQALADWLIAAEPRAIVEVQSLARDDAAGRSWPEGDRLIRQALNTGADVTLTQAAACGDVAKVRRLISVGVNTCYADRAFQKAIANGQEATARLLWPVADRFHPLDAVNLALGNGISSLMFCKELISSLPSSIQAYTTPDLMAKTARAGRLDLLKMVYAHGQSLASSMAADSLTVVLDQAIVAEVSKVKGAEACGRWLTHTIGVPIIGLAEKYARTANWSFTDILVLWATPECRMKYVGEMADENKVELIRTMPVYEAERRAEQAGAFHLGPDRSRLRQRP